MICSDIKQSKYFGHQLRETSTSIEVEITEMKAVYTFKKMNLDGTPILFDQLFKKY